MLPWYYRDGRYRQKLFKKRYYGRWDLVFWLWPRNKSTEFWMGRWDIPRPKELKFQSSRIKTMLITFRLSVRSAQRICTRRKNCKCKILERSKEWPPEAHSSDSSSCVLLSTFVLDASPHKAVIVWQLLTQKSYNSLMPPVISRFISVRLFSVPQVENEVKSTPRCGCCWEPRRRNWWIKQGPKMNFQQFFR
jgi:hypothetical protein